MTFQLDSIEGSGEQVVKLLKFLVVPTERVPECIRSMLY